MNEWERGKYKEIWIHSQKNEQVMGGWINGEFGFITYMRDGWDEGFTSRNPEYKGSDEERMEFYQSSGQIRVVPMSWVISAEDVKRALEHFSKNNYPPYYILWHDDNPDEVKFQDQRNLSL